MGLLDKFESVKGKRSQLGEEETKGETQAEQKRSFSEVLVGKTTDSGKPLKPIAAPRQEEGNIVVQLDYEDCKNGVRDLQFSIVRKLSMLRGEDLPMNMELKKK